MSEVKVHRYDVNLCPDRQCDCGASFATEECPDSNGDYVRYVDHEKELAALREELAKLESKNANQGETIRGYQDRIEQAIKDAYEWGYGDGQNNPNGYSSEKNRDKCLHELTKPTESGECE